MRQFFILARFFLAIFICRILFVIILAFMKAGCMVIAGVIGIVFTIGTVALMFIAGVFLILLIIKAIELVQKIF